MQEYSAPALIAGRTSDEIANIPNDPTDAADESDIAALKVEGENIET